MVSDNHANGKDEDVDAFTEKYAEMLKDMRSKFASGKTKDLAWRRKQLENALNMISEKHEEITAAVRKDLGGSKLRGIGELGVGGAADNALKNLDSWTKEQWTCGWLSRGYVRPEPKGVVLIIAPWNFPFILLLEPMVAAIAAGNCVVLKPSEHNLTCCPLIDALVKRYMDPECVRVVHGSKPETTALLNQRWDHIFFTGSPAIGRVVMAAAAKHLTPVTLELGGKSPCIIDETANMEATCQRIAFAKWTNAGQVCVSPDYALVHESRLKEFVDVSKSLVVKSFGEDPKVSPEYFKIIDERHVERVRRMIDTSGGEVVCGGSKSIDVAARYVPPTIIVKPSMDALVMEEEIFGPVLPVIPFKDLGEAIDVANSKSTPLALYVYSQSNRNIERVLSTCPSGGAAVNTSLEHIIQADLPFGGQGESGMGSYHGKYGFDEFSHKRAVFRKTTLPLLRGPAYPLPVDGKPLPDFVYTLIVKTLVTGVLPRRLVAFLKSKPVAILVVALLTSRFIAKPWKW
eukprot:TRINITY_DN12343_c0_g1_i1.p1 TRINITY_DN12343_c0_g1~~TRINITY_DN12343_c0_g1_i1.p1  ORF type:complete len:516 (+),score=76.91 TRINITY_DN12343_c0_g1_i1:68-1615(+)